VNQLGQAKQQMERRQKRQRIYCIYSALDVMSLGTTQHQKIACYMRAKRKIKMRKQTAHGDSGTV
jgi:hypothetical protein